VNDKKSQSVLKHAIAIQNTGKNSVTIILFIANCC